MKGKTKGSVSFVRVKLEELNRVFSPNAMIPVGRLFAQETGLQSVAITSFEVKEISVPEVLVKKVELDNI